MKKTNFLKLSVVALAFIIASCSNTEEVPRGEYANGIFVINEGNFSEANGSIGFYEEVTSESSQDIFAAANIY